ncbi:MAG: radical SAM protein [Euryarchaeota archaeon]|nr:radical SAM protein [Euryarchaeota archaeon]
MKNSRNRVLLLYPTAEAGDMSLVPLSLLYIAQPLIEEGIDVEIIDQRFEEAFFERLRQRIIPEPICIGINCITGPQIEHVIKISAFLRSVTDAPIVLGGPHPTLFPAQTLGSPFIDYVVIGKGEAPFLNLVKALRENASLEGVSRIGYKDNGRVVVNKGFVQEINIRTIPYYLVSRYGRPSTIPIISSYGCPYHCAFCVEKVLHPVYQEIPLADVLFIIGGALRLKPQFISFLDDNFLLSRRRVLDLFALCRQENFGFVWVCMGRVDEVLRLSDETLGILKQSGLLGIYFGIESGSQKILKLIDKGITLEMVLKLNIRMKKEGIVPHYSFMAGFPGETRMDFEETVRLMGRLKEENPQAVIWKINRYTPYPGTRLFDAAVQSGFRPPETFEGWSRVHFYSEEFDLQYNQHL